MSNLISFTTAQEVKNWFKERGYILPIVTERKKDWKLQWRIDGNEDLANTIAEDLKESGYAVSDVFVATGYNNLRMQMFIAKPEEATYEDKIKKVCVDELGIYTPAVKELKDGYKLTWVAMGADKETLKNKVAKLRKKYEVKESYVKYSFRRGGDYPSGYVVVIKK